MQKKILLAILLAGVAGLIYTCGIAVPNQYFKAYSRFESRNNVYILMTDTEGEIFNTHFLKTLKDLTTNIFYLPQVHRTGIVSLTDPNLMYSEVTVEGFDRRSIIDEDFVYGERGYDVIKSNLLKSPYVGQLVSRDLRSTIIVAPYLPNADGLEFVRQLKALLPRDRRIHFSLIGYAPLVLDFKKEFGHSLLWLLISLAGGWVIFVLMKINPGQAVLSRKQNIFVTLFFGILGLVAASSLVIGHVGSGPSLLRSGSEYQQAQKYVTEHFAISGDSILVLAISRNGCVDPATVSALQKFHWAISGLPGIHGIKIFSAAVQRLNMFFHESNIRWQVIPREKPTLITAAGPLEPKTGLIDETGLIMPVTIFLKDHNPYNLARVMDTIRTFTPPQDLFTLKVAGGTAGRELMVNEQLAGSIQLILWFLLAAVFVASRLFLPLRSALEMSFVYCVIVSMTLGVFAFMGRGLSLDAVWGILIGSCLSLFFLFRSERSAAALFAAMVMISGGLLSNINLFFEVAVVAEWMLIWTWLVGFKFFPVKIS